MTMRVPNLMNNAQTMLDLQRVKQQYSTTIQQLTTGKSIVNLGDDPTTSTQIMNYQSSIDLNSQFITQADRANSQLQSTSTVVTSIASDINRVLDLTQAGLASTTTGTGRAAEAAEVDSLRTALISLGNTQSQGKYIFAGTHTTTIPFVDNVPAAPPLPQSVTYQGNSGTTSLNLGVGTSVTTNLPGDSLFFGPGGQGSATDLLAQVTAVRDALTSNDTVALQSAYDNLKAVSTRIGVVTTDLGGRENGISAIQNGLSDFNANLDTQKTNLESVDYPTAITNLNQQSLAQQASLSAMSKSNQRTLFDYLA